MRCRLRPAICKGALSRKGVLSVEARKCWEPRNFSNHACDEMLCEKGADVNKEDIKGRTCLHLACDAYRENSESSDDMRFEEIVIQLCKRGAAGIKDNAGKAPDCGDSACLAVSAAVDRAWHAGESIRDGLEAKRRARRKAKMDAIFAGKLASHINNASAAAITVMDTGENDGYKYGSRGNNP